MRISLNLLALSGCKLKSPNIYKLSWSGISYLVNIKIHQKLTCTVLKSIQTDRRVASRTPVRTCVHIKGGVKKI